MTRGRKRKPTAIRKAMGNPRQKPLPEHEPEFDSIVISPPEFLTGHGLRMWDRLQPSLLAAGVLTGVDYGTLETYCRFYQRWMDAETELEKTVMVVESPNKYPMSNPYISIATRAAEMMNKLAAELGITPAARSKVTATPPADGKEVDPFTR